MIAISRSASLAGFLQLIKTKSSPLILFPTLASNTHNLEGPVNFPSKSFEFSRAAWASLALLVPGNQFYRHCCRKLLPLLLCPLGKGAVPRNNGVGRQREPLGELRPGPSGCAWDRTWLQSQDLRPPRFPVFLPVFCSKLCWKTAKRDPWP